MLSPPPMWVVLGVRSNSNEGYLGSGPDDGTDVISLSLTLCFPSDHQIQSSTGWLVYNRQLVSDEQFSGCLTLFSYFPVLRVQCLPTKSISDLIPHSW